VRNSLAIKSLVSGGKKDNTENIGKSFLDLQQVTLGLAMAEGPDFKPEKPGRNPLDEWGSCRTTSLTEEVFREAGEEGKKHIPATQAVVLNEG